MCGLRAIVGAICLVVSVIYFAVQADLTPSFMPSYVASTTVHRSLRELAVVILAVVPSPAIPIGARRQRRGRWRRGLHSPRSRPLLRCA